MVDGIVRSGLQNTAVHGDIAVKRAVLTIARDRVPACFDMTAVDDDRCVAIFILDAHRELTLVGVVRREGSRVDQTAFHDERTAVYRSDQNLIL